MEPAKPVTHLQNTPGQCPHCGRSIFFNGRTGVMDPSYLDPARKPVQGETSPHIAARFAIMVEGDPKEWIAVAAGSCPACNRVVLVMFSPAPDKTVSRRLLFPEGIARSPIPATVPEHVAEDYREAVMVLPYSPKASAALSRRCLQNLLHARGIEKKTLAQEIDEALKTLPPYLAHDLDAVRHVGNMAAHPMKSEVTGTIVGVEPGEAEWTIEVIEMLFDHYYVRPEDSRARREALNRKLADAGKPTLKGPPEGG